MTELLEVVIRDKKGLVWQSLATSISSTNAKGAFDILPEHTNFVSVIDKVLIVRDEKNLQRQLDFKRGIIRVQKNQVEIYFL